MLMVIAVIFIAFIKKGYSYLNCTGILHFFGARANLSNHFANFEICGNAFFVAAYEIQDACFGTEGWGSSWIKNVADKNKLVGERRIHFIDGKGIAYGRERLCSGRHP